MKDEEILNKAITIAVRNGYQESVYNHSNDIPVWDALPIIFSHDFAKAFWKDCNCQYHDIPGWRWHLQQMVLEENPIKYLEKLVGGNK